MKVLITFRHGLGDAVQLTAVLRHIARFRPDWRVTVASLSGKHTAHKGLCHEVKRLKTDPIDSKQYAKVFDLNWEECNATYADSPSTKVEKCLREVFEITPVKELLGYEIRLKETVKHQASLYLRQISGSPDAQGRFPVGILHYQGNTSATRKNLTHEQAEAICRTMLAAGIVPVILDWDRRSPLPDGRTIHCPDVTSPLWGMIGTGDASAIAALISQATLAVCIDSGPQKVAAATQTPTLAVWTGHHPIHYIAPANHVTNLVPQDHANRIRGDQRKALKYFQENYRYETYSDLAASACEWVRQTIVPPNSDLVRHRGFWVRRRFARQDDVIVKDIGEDDAYKVGQVPLPVEYVVDVGAHIGVFASKWHARNRMAKIVCVEACPENIPALKANVGSFAQVVHGACAYQEEPLVLLNAVTGACVSTGGSRVVTRHEALLEKDTQYALDERPLTTVTLEDLMERFALPRIDLLKLDCEGSEFSILENTRVLDRIGRIIGEYHGFERFKKLVNQRFSDWKLTWISQGEIGNFWLEAPAR